MIDKRNDINKQNNGTTIMILCTEKILRWHQKISKMFESDSFKKSYCQRVVCPNR
jgi:hypothetical protein